MPGQQGFDHAGLALKRIGLHFPLALPRPERLGHRQHVGSRRTVEMMCQKPIDLRGAETTLRLQHQADRGGRRRLQAIQTVLNDMDGLMGQNIQLKPWLIAAARGHTVEVHHRSYRTSEWRSVRTAFAQAGGNHAALLSKRQQQSAELEQLV